MKIRTGFVANSSSCSFAAAVGIVKKKDIEEFNSTIKKVLDEYEDIRYIEWQDGMEKDSDICNYNEETGIINFDSDYYETKINVNDLEKGDVIVVMQGSDNNFIRTLLKGIDRLFLDNPLIKNGDTVLELDEYR